MRNVELQIDTWDIKMTRPMTLWGIITLRIEDIVTHYSIMIDKAKTMASKKEVEREFMLTMLSHGILCD